MYNLYIIINGLDYNNMLWVSKKYYALSEFTHKVNSISLKIKEFIENHYNYNVYISMVNDGGEMKREILFKDVYLNKVILDLNFYLQAPFISIDSSKNPSVYTLSTVYDSSLWDKFNNEIYSQIIDNSKYKTGLEDFDQWRRL